MSARIQSLREIHRFVTAGNATFTLQSKVTGDHFTFKVHTGDTQDPVTRQRTPTPNRLVVKVLCGPDNSRNYLYIGSIKNNVYTFWSSASRDSFLKEKSRSGQAFMWFWKMLTAKPQQLIPGVVDGYYQHRFDSQCEFLHMGKCGRCGRPLTVPESIRTGLGPECAQAMQAEGLLGSLDLLGGIDRA